MKHVKCIVYDVMSNPTATIE
nr:hypothetical protein [Bacillus cereus]